MKNKILIFLIVIVTASFLLILFWRNRIAPFASELRGGKTEWFEIVLKQCENQELRTDEFFRKQGITIHARKWILRKELVCAACGCPEARTLALLVSEPDSEKMRSLGFARSSGTERKQFAFP